MQLCSNKLWVRQYFIYPVDLNIKEENAILN